MHRATDSGLRSKNGSSGQIPAAVTLSIVVSAYLCHVAPTRYLQSVNPSKVLYYLIKGLLKHAVIGYIAPLQFVRTFHVKVNIQTHW